MKEEQRLKHLFEKIMELMQSDMSFDEQHDAFLEYLVNIDRDDVYSIMIEMISIIITMDTPAELIYSPDKFMNKDIYDKEEDDKPHLKLVH